MSRGIAAASSHRRYGATDSAPEIGLSDSSHAEEIENLCEDIANSIDSINKNTKKLERDAQIIGTQRDNQTVRDNANVTQVKCNELVAVTLEKLNKSNKLVRNAGKQCKLQVERLQADMSTAVCAYATAQKLVTDKIKQHVLLVPVSPTDEEPDQLLVREREAAYNQQQSQLQKDLDFEGGMLEDRLIAIQGVEAKIIDVNQIMLMLAAMAQEQAAVVDTIEQNTENTLANVESANRELIKASSYHGRRRKTAFCILLVAIVVAIIILAVVLSK